MSYHREKQVLPQIGDIRWRKDGFGTQIIKFGAGGTVSEIIGGESVPSNPIQRGYVKIWYQGEVIDRALTVKNARRRIAQLKQQAFPVNMALRQKP